MVIQLYKKLLVFVSCVLLFGRKRERERIDKKRGWTWFSFDNSNSIILIHIINQFLYNNRKSSVAVAENSLHTATNGKGLLEKKVNLFSSKLERGHNEDSLWFVCKLVLYKMHIG